MGGSPSRRERRAALFGTPAAERTQETEQPSQRVMQMLRGNTNPLVAITVVYPDLARGGISYPRSMGFMVERFDKGHRLVVTCRHAFMELGRTGSRLVVGFKSPTHMMLTCIGDPIYDTEAENDIVFLIVRDPSNSPTKPFDLSQPDPVIHDGMTLWNAQNQCEPLEGKYHVLASRQQPAWEMEQVVFCKFSSPDVHCTPMTNIAEQEEYRRAGWLQCRLLGMVSRPSYSGSFIWDDHLRLYGMDVRGSTPEQNPGVGDQLVCIPNSALLAARLRVEALIQERLRSTR